MAPKYNILIVDDEDKIRWSIRNYIDDEERITFYEAASGEEAFRILNTVYVDIVLLDIVLPDKNGLEILKEIKSRYYSTQVIIVTAYANVQDIVEAIHHGAADYIQKPFALEDLKIKIYKSIELDTIQNSLASILRSKKPEEYGNLVIANDPKTISLLEFGEQLALKDADCILITGETGTGKEEFANHIYRRNTRRNTEPFVTVNCNSLTSSLMDAELFGYEKGAFTDAKGKKDGLFKAANKGIIFLDEIGDMHPELQGKLLRVIEKKVVRRIGGTEDEHLDVMVILATNKNLEAQVAGGFFRSDLYFRINTFEIHIPPLRERKGDILPLAYLFLEKFNKKFSKKFTHITKESEGILLNHAWPGNVRELKNLFENIVMLGQGHEITADMLKEKSLGRERDSHVRKENIRGDHFLGLDSLEEFYVSSKVNIIRKVLNECNGNISKAAEKLKIDRSTLNYTIKKYQIVHRFSSVSSELRV